MPTQLSVGKQEQQMCVCIRLQEAIVNTYWHEVTEITGKFSDGQQEIKPCLQQWNFTQLII